ncbi:MAG TPA: hypothetical protein VIL20_00785 [Sandaracinaceae bacterium]
MAEVVWIGTVILVAAIVAALGYAAWWKRRYGRDELRRRFGPEYDRAVEDTGSGAAARRELRARIRHVRKLPLRDLSPRERDDFRSRQKALEASFVDDPARAVAALERLAQELARARGYPSASFEQRLADLSVHHAPIVGCYREARALAKSGASTERLRRALSRYRTLLNELREAPLREAPRRARTAPLPLEHAEHA